MRAGHSDCAHQIDSQSNLCTSHLLVEVSACLELLRGGSLGLLMIYRAFESRNVARRFAINVKIQMQGKWLIECQARVRAERCRRAMFVAAGAACLDGRALLALGN